MDMQGMMCIIIATYAKAAGLNHDEAPMLLQRLLTRETPHNVYEAYGMLDEATQHIRHNRNLEDW